MRIREQVLNRLHGPAAALAAIAMLTGMAAFPTVAATCNGSNCATWVQQGYNCSNITSNTNVGTLCNASAADCDLPLAPDYNWNCYSQNATCTKTGEPQETCSQCVTLQNNCCNSPGSGSASCSI